MPKIKKRIYKSPVRQRQAGDTRRRIVEATRHLLESEGYAGMTIEAIARRAEVSAQSVYGIFKSKTQAFDRGSIIGPPEISYGCLLAGTYTGCWCASVGGVQRNTKTGWPTPWCNLSSLKAVQIRFAVGERNLVPRRGRFEVERRTTCLFKPRPDNS